MATQPAPRVRYMPGLDGLRGLAVAAVVLFHLGRLPGGYLGVDLFFVLSGFLITWLLLRESVVSESVDLVGFWGRRARRLLPALGILLMGVVLYAWLLAEPEASTRLRWDALATLLYVANWREVFSGVDYWSLFTAPSPLNHTWSLAIEEQFYLVWPIVFIGVLRWSKRAAARSGGALRVELVRRVLIVASGLAVVSLVATVVLGRTVGWSRVYFGTDTRAFAILIGAVLAAVNEWVGSIRAGAARRALEGVSVCAVVLLAVAWWRLSGGSWLVRHGGLEMCSIAAGVVVFAVSQPEATFVGRIVAWEPFRRLGLVSYGVYLYHWPVIVVLDSTRVHLTGWPLDGVRVAVTVVIAVASYLLVERPVRARGFWRKPRLTWIPAAASILIATLVVLATSTPAAESRTDSAGLIREAVDTADRNDGPRLMMIGNSVAYFLGAEGFTAGMTRPPLTVLNLGRLACLEPGGDAFAFPDGTVVTSIGYSCDLGDWADAAGKFHPDVTLFMQNGMPFSRMRRDGKWIDVCSDAYRELTVRIFGSYGRRFSRVGSRFVVATAVPSPPSAVRNAKWSDYLQDVVCVNDALRDAARENPETMELLDLEEEFCPDVRHCRVESKAGTPLRSDGTHFRGSGARDMARLLVDRLDLSDHPAQHRVGESGHDRDRAD